MNLRELQAVLSERIRLANSPSEPTERKQQNEQSQIICALAKQMINNADIALRTEKLAVESNITGSTIDRMVNGPDFYDNETSVH